MRLFFGQCYTNINSSVNRIPPRVKYKPLLKGELFTANIQKVEITTKRAGMSQRKYLENRAGY